MKDKLPSHLTINQLVAFNLAVARDEKGWTQEQAAERLEPLLGQRWSRATFSAAERSVNGRRPREFTVNEIVAFALAFNHSVAWFFTPPETNLHFHLDAVVIPDGQRQPRRSDRVELIGTRMLRGLVTKTGVVPSLSMEVVQQLRAVADRVETELMLAEEPQSDLQSPALLAERTPRK